MKITIHANATFLRITFVAALLTLSTVNCKKTVVKNPFTEITTLDCRNLLIRSIELKDTVLELTIENTCKNCQEANDVYDAIFMIDRQTGDTLYSSCYCFAIPKNGESLKYPLYNTNLTTLPDLKTVQFDLLFRCKDLTYLPK